MGRHLFQYHDNILWLYFSFSIIATWSLYTDSGVNNFNWLGGLLPNHYDLHFIPIYYYLPLPTIIHPTKILLTSVVIRQFSPPPMWVPIVS